MQSSHILKQWQSYKRNLAGLTIEQVRGLTWTNGAAGVGLDTVPYASGAPIEWCWIGAGPHSPGFPLSTLDWTLCPWAPTWPASINYNDILFKFIFEIIL